MASLKRTHRRVAVGLVAGAVLPLAGASSATAGNRPPGRQVRYEEAGAFDRIGSAWHRYRERASKTPFEHYAHNPGDLTTRPICPPYCSPTAGYFEPCWHRLPPGPGCPSPGFFGLPPAPAGTASPTLVPAPMPADEADLDDVPSSEMPEEPAAPEAPPAAPLPEATGEIRQTGGTAANLWREGY